MGMQKEIGWAVRSRELAVRSITKSLGTTTFIEQLFFRPFFLASFGKRAPETALHARALRTPGLGGSVPRAARVRKRSKKRSGPPCLLIRGRQNGSKWPYIVIINKCDEIPAYLYRAKHISLITLFILNQK